MEPTEATTIRYFLEQLDEKADIWFDIVQLSQYQRGSYNSQKKDKHSKSATRSRHLKLDEEFEDQLAYEQSRQRKLCKPYSRHHFNDTPSSKSFTPRHKESKPFKPQSGESKQEKSSKDYDKKKRFNYKGEKDKGRDKEKQAYLTKEEENLDDDLDYYDPKYPSDSESSEDNETLTFVNWISANSATSTPSIFYCC